MQFSDEWLVPTLAPLVGDDEILALRREKDRPESLWETLTSRSRLADAQIMDAIAGRFHLVPADLEIADPKARDAIPEQVARRYQVLPLRATDSFLEVATANPFDMDAEKMLAFATGREVRLLLCSPARIRERLDDLYRPESVVEKLLSGMVETTVTQIDETVEEEVSAEEAGQRPIVRLVDTMLADGIACRASDIHIEPVEGGIVVRYRIDGVLRQVMKIPRSAGIPLISRIKIISGMDIADRLRPQDGRTRVAVNGEPVDLRVSTLPASLGEKVVIRVLNTKTTVLQLPALGLEDEELERVTRLLQHKEGIVLVTGPTGSGKTTTLYAALRTVQNEGVNIVTVEDPVEYRLGANIVQVQTNERAGLTFASALRSILRQDPDVVLIGEIRDTETAQIAVQASLTGHLVLSTLHTNDAPNSVTRLVDMGMEAYKIASALRGVIAQRLLRRLCPVCKEVATEPPPPHMTQWLPEGVTLYRAVGCKECASTGYRGRFGIMEVLTMSPELERLVGSGATADLITEEARVAGMRSLFESGLRRVISGITSVDELLRVTDPPRLRGAAKKAAIGAVDAAIPSTATASAVVEAPPVDALASGFELVEDLAEQEGHPSGEGPPIRVLLVDDEEPLRRVMKDLLERDGYTVAEAGDGVVALDQVDRFAPDVVILDLNLPGLDGYAVLTHLRSRPTTAHVPVIVLTAKGDEDNEVRVIEMGATDFLTKPFRPRALSARIEALSQRRNR